MALTVKKSTLITLVDDNNESFEVDDRMIFKAGDRCLVGVYKGIANRGALIFQGIQQFSDCEYHVMPSAIQEIYKF